MIKYDENKLRQIVNECNTYREVLIKFERNKSGASYKTLHRRLKEWSIDTSHFLNRSELLKFKNGNGLYQRKTRKRKSKNNLTKIKYYERRSI